jgi:nucleoside-diphosphate-sugar epimerase
MTQNVILVTGAAGFIGFHVVQRLLSSGRDVVGLDSVNDYYDPRLKETRVDILKRQSNFTFVKFNLADRERTRSLFQQHRFPVVIHLAAQAGVRYSLENPHAYIDANIEGFMNVLEGSLLEKEFGRTAIKEMLPMQARRCAGNLCRYRRSGARHRIRQDEVLSPAPWMQ